MCAINQQTAGAVLPLVEPLVDDAEASVRLAFADHFRKLWEFRRASLWEFADHIAYNEHNCFVLRSLIDFLCRAVHHDPEKVEALTIKLIPRARQEVDAQGDRMIEAIGSLVAVLWMYYERPQSRQLLDTWLQDLAPHEAELSQAASSLRDTVVAGYGSGKDEDIRLRRNAQRLAGEIVDAAAMALDQYLAKHNDERDETDSASARASIKLLDLVGDQFYFSAGAFRANSKQEQTGLIDLGSKRAFLADVYNTLRRIGDIASPHTVYNFIDLLDFLMPADPPQVFDLVTHCLLNAGRKWGYEYESLGADRFVKVVGVVLADHRDIFNESFRRDNLIACLDAFVEAGWPSARALLYRLPELL